MSRGGILEPSDRAIEAVDQRIELAGAEFVEPAQIGNDPDAHLCQARRDGPRRVADSGDRRILRCAYTLDERYIPIGPQRNTNIVKTCYNTISPKSSQGTSQPIEITRTAPRSTPNSYRLVSNLGYPAHRGISMAKTPLKNLMIRSCPLRQQTPFTPKDGVSLTPNKIGGDVSAGTGEEIGGI